VGGDDSDEQHCEAPIVADNWGGLFEQPAHILKERVHILPACEDEIPNHLDRANSNAVSITPASAPSSATVSNDVLALVALESGLSDPAGRLAPWSEDADRVRDPRTGRIAALDLPAASLAGRLPRSALLRLDALVSLALAGNHLFGMLPDALPPHLHVLDVSGNAISGGIPASLVSSESLNLPPTKCLMQVRNSNSSSSLLLTSPIAPASALLTPTAAFMTVAPFPAPTIRSTARVKFSSIIIDNQGMAAPRPLTVTFVDVNGPVKHLPVYELVVANKPVSASLDTEWVLDEMMHKQLCPPPVLCEYRAMMFRWCSVSPGFLPMRMSSRSGVSPTRFRSPCPTGCCTSGTDHGHHLYSWRYIVLVFS
jgi:hypothetical protein